MVRKLMKISRAYIGNLFEQVSSNSCIDYPYKFTSNTHCLVKESRKVWVQCYNCKFSGREALKCALSIAALARIWRNEGVTDYNSFDHVLQTPLQGHGSSRWLCWSIHGGNSFVALYCLLYS